MNTPDDSALSEYAFRLLHGTDLDPGQAEDVAAGRIPCAGPVADALRSGWTSVADLLPAEVSERVPNSSTAPGPRP